MLARFLVHANHPADVDLLAVGELVAVSETDLVVLLGVVVIDGPEHARLYVVTERVQVVHVLTQLIGHLATVYGVLGIGLLFGLLLHLFQDSIRIGQSVAVVVDGGALSGKLGGRCLSLEIQRVVVGYGADFTLTLRGQVVVLVRVGNRVGYFQLMHVMDK